MKRFLIVCAAILAVVLVYLFLADQTGLYIDFSPNREVTTFTKVVGKEIYVDEGAGMEPFEIRGVDMGVGIPGHFATDYAIDKATYLRWFEMIQEMGANCVRVYTILPDDFYNALYEYNVNREEPLYIIHGLWLNDYILNSHRSAFDDEFIGALIEDSRVLVDILHGNKRFSLNEDLGSGTYNRDVSPWVLGYILGVEWEDTTVAYTDHMDDDKNEYIGEYMYTTEDATPFEAMLAQVGDRIIGYETNRYKTQRLVAFSNWPTTDPLDWGEMVSYYFRKFAKVDVEHIRTTDAFIAGQFASYHIYPYYPDYYGFMDTIGEVVPGMADFVEDGVFNSYRAYLAAINQHHTMPVVVSEYGVPSARGRAQTDRNTGRSQGGLSEKEQAEALVQCYEDVVASGCAGTVIFSWQDEWFKRTWNTMAYTDLTKTPYWSDVQTNEQHFGLLTFDPGKEKSVCYVDGDVSEWEDATPVVSQDGYTLYLKYDEESIYLRIHKEGLDLETDKLYVPLDITPKSGSTTALGYAATFERAADFLLVLDGKENSEVLVQQRYEALRAMYSHRVYLEDAYLNPPAADTDVFTSIRMILQVPTDPREELANTGFDTADTYDTGRLRHGNGNPESPDFDSLADFCINGDNVEIRLPWLLLNFSNPSEMMIHDDYYENYGVENLQISSIHLGVGPVGADIQMGEAKLSGWGRSVTYHERLKEGYYALQSIWNP